MLPETKKAYRLSRAMVVVDAMLEYWVSLLIVDSFLANATRAIGISDALTGILSSFISLSCAMQIFSLLLARKTPYKIWTMTLEILGELLFAVLYIVPVVNIPTAAKTVIFASLLLVGQISLKIVLPQRTIWVTSLLDENERGIFHSRKAIILLLSGMIFSIGAGYVIDTLTERGMEKEAFIVIAASITVIAAMHLVSIILTKEPPTEYKTLRLREMIKKLVRDKTALKVMVVPVAFEAAVFITNPFLGSFKISELGLDLTYISLMSAVYAVVRSLFSQKCGRIADKKGFAHLYFILIPFYIISYAMIIISDASNAKITIALYYVFYAIALAGTNTCSTFILLDYVEPDMQLCVTALKGVFAGLAGFLVALAAAVPVSLIQKAGGVKLFGHTFYAQQVMSFCSIICLSLLMVYIAKVISRLKMSR